MNFILSESCKDMKDNTINLNMLIQVINLFDVKDIVAMRNFVGLSVPKEWKDDVFQMRNFKLNFNFRNI